jgi:hypothetical protein
MKWSIIATGRKNYLAAKDTKGHDEEKGKKHENKEKSAYKRETSRHI